MSFQCTLRCVLLVVLCNSLVFAVENPCCAFPCQHNAVCVEEKTGYSCDCTRTGYYGKDCQTPEWSTWLGNLLRPSQETVHYLLNNFQWFWNVVNSVDFIRDPLLRFVYKRRLGLVDLPPVHASGHPYTTMEVYYNRSYYAMSLPPVPKNCPTPFGVTGKKVLPDPQQIVDRILARREFKPDHMNTSLLFACFAQHFTHQFFKTDYGQGPGITWGRHGVDVSNLYGGTVERENVLRTFKDGRLKSQMINGEEWPPYLKDANVTMQYDPSTPEDNRFALGHPFFALFPGLFMFNAIWLREHNRVCSILKEQHPTWDDEQVFQTAKLIITGETIKIVIEDYVQTLASYHMQLKYKPELLFGEGITYDNRIHVEFAHLYHWHPFIPDEFTIQGTKYTIDEFLFNAMPVVKHGMQGFVDAMSKSLAGKMVHHNHGKHVQEVGVSIIQHERDMRMQSFNNYRKRFNLKPYQSFEELTDDKELAADLQELYRFKRLLSELTDEFGEDVNVTGESTQGITGYFEVSVDGKEVHSKKNGDGFVDNEAKLNSGRIPRRRKECGWRHWYLDLTAAMRSQCSPMPRPLPRPPPRLSPVISRHHPRTPPTPVTLTYSHRHRRHLFLHTTAVCVWGGGGGGVGGHANQLLYCDGELSMGRLCMRTCIRRPTS